MKREEIEELRRLMALRAYIPYDTMARLILERDALLEALKWVPGSGGFEGEPGRILDAIALAES